MQLTEVSTPVVVQSLRVLVDNIRGDFVQECTIVGNDKNCARVSLKIIGKESNGRNVQHVRRFWENVSQRLNEEIDQCYIPSSKSKSGSQNRARARDKRILQPPENVFVAYC